MSKKSNITKIDIIRSAQQKNLDLIYCPDTIVNNEVKVLVRCRECGGYYEPGIGTVMSNKGRCPYQPCHPKGKLRLSYITEEMRKVGATVKSPVHVPVESPGQLLGIDCHTEKLHKAKDPITFEFNGETKTTTWDRIIRSGTRRCEKYGSESLRKTLAMDFRAKPTNYDLEQAKAIFMEQGLNLLETEYKTESTHMECICLDHGHKTKKTLRTVREGKYRGCDDCYPFTCADRFNSFLAEHGMRFIGSKLEMKNPMQVLRTQPVMLECAACGTIQNGRTYDQIRYRGFTFCMNEKCRNFNSLDASRPDFAEFKKLCIDNGVTSLHQAQILLPKSFNRLRGRRMNEFADQQGWQKHEKYENDDENMLRELLAPHSGKRLNELKMYPDRKISNMILRFELNDRDTLLAICKELNITIGSKKIPQDYDEIIEHLLPLNIRSVPDLERKCPSIMKIIRANQWTDRVCKEFGLYQLPNFSALSDEDRIMKAVEIGENLGATTTEEIAVANPGLVANLRERKLLDRVRERLGIPILMHWKDTSYMDLKDFVMEQGVISPTDWHREYSGSYKYASEKEWLESIAKDLNLKAPCKDSQGNLLGSFLEAAVSEIFQALGVKIISFHPRLNFEENGRRTLRAADFLIRRSDEKRYYVEVWGVFDGDIFYLDGPGSYSERRQSKVCLCKRNGDDLIEIEGMLYYKSRSIDGKTYQNGLPGLAQHVVDRLNSAGFGVVLSDAALARVRDNLNKVKERQEAAAENSESIQQPPFSAPLIAAETNVAINY
ncbi:hypothetical protein OR1_02634 [Geobacter sp. OR-1]|uniref:hypothetical protein n=1 Tax=Geobacter sp. OR-1 TaxID=1266765 RepID=UPI00054424ED|nr:hypothetical protein [Geobacter sp. OR-1]GAM10345.1 hypothetical protein OR1_02634 [Geobacter sp. OR-1]